MSRSAPNDAVGRIHAFNAGRDPERLAMKDTAMRQDAFVFLRGTCHLFYEDLAPSDLPPSPLVWGCGDLHLQNFGTYKGDNRLTYFDLNDFDEACLAPATWELVRFLTSIAVGGKTLGMDRPTARALMREFLNGYAAALQSGKARWLERATAAGMIRALLSQLKKRSRKSFLNSRTVLVTGKRRLRLDGKHALPLDQSQQASVHQFMTDFASRQPDPAFFRPRDAARRVAGTGSLGLERYVILVEGRGSPHGNFLLDLKHQPGSCIVAARHMRQPKWTSEGARVTVTQHDAQAVSPALLQAVEWHGRSFVIHELMPSNDRLDIANWRNDLPAFSQAIRRMGEIVAWSHLRTSARRGAADPAALIDFGGDLSWLAPLVGCAFRYATRIERQWRQYREAAPIIAEKAKEHA